MADKTTPNMDEYKFTDPETGAENAPEQQPAFNFDKRKLIVPGIIVLAILLIYGIFSFYGSRKSRLAEQQIPQPIVTTLAPAPVVTQSSSDLINEQIEKSYEATKQRINEAMEEVSKKDLDKISELANTVSRSQQDISDINQAVNQLTASMQQVLTEIQSLKAKPKKKKPSGPLTVYHVRAIVPGRAWLESANGKNLTLRVGDRLNGYGTVEAISPQQGTVMMSNGSTIQYGVNDF
jgi:intracellular multiplication protein IcmG